jgi:hypothetical protein
MRRELFHPVLKETHRAVLSDQKVEERETVVGNLSKKEGKI